MPLSYHSKPSLDNAFARVTRAEEHLARLEAEIDSALKRSIVIGSGITGLLTATGYNLPKIVPILIGEVVYKLRAALDYLIFQLVYLDGGKVKNGTKFPIEDNADGWQFYFLSPKSAGGSKRRRRKLWLPILTPGHQAAIKALQPFDGCRWTYVLRSISNPDKHRNLIVTDAQVAARITTNASVEDFAIPPMPDSTVYVEGHVSAIVAFKDRSPVIETLKELQKEVASVLTSFNRDF